MNIRLYGHEQLHRDHYPAVIDKSQAETARDLMFGYMRKFEKPEISAPQLGLPINMAAVTLSSGAMQVLVNPKITQMLGMELIAEEVCVSCPPKGNRCMVPRMQVVGVSMHAIERLGWKEHVSFKGIDARNVQHAIDHLSGVFFFDRAAGPERKKITERFEEWRKMRKIINLTVSTREK